MWLVSFFSSSLTPSSPPLPSPTLTLYLPSPTYSLLPSYLPLPFLSISAYTRTLSHQPRSFPSVPSLFYLHLLLPLPFLSTYTRTIYLTLPLRPQPIFSPPPSTLTLPIYTHSLLPLASLFTPLPCLFPLPPPSDERDEG